MQFSAFLQQEGGRFVIHYLGDILLTEIPGSEGCADSFEDIQASYLEISNCITKVISFKKKKIAEIKETDLAQCNVYIMIT